MGSSPTLSSLQTDLTNLTSRVNLLDGQNLVAPFTGFTSQTTARINGAKADINGAVLGLEADINELRAWVQAATAGINTLLGLAGQPPIVPPPTVPPTT